MRFFYRFFENKSQIFPFVKLKITIHREPFKFRVILIYFKNRAQRFLREKLRKISKNAKNRRTMKKREREKIIQRFRATVLRFRFFAFFPFV